MNARPRHVLGVAGSLRRGSYNRLLLEAAAQRVPQDMSLIVYRDLASVPMFNEDTELEGVPPGVERLRRAVADADAVLFATPEYNNSIPAVLKNAIDWLSRPGLDDVLVGKPVAVIGSTTGNWGTRLAQAALRQVLFSTRSLVMPNTSALFVRRAGELFDADGRLHDDAIHGELDELLRSLGIWMVQANGSAASAT